MERETREWLVAFFIHNIKDVKKNRYLSDLLDEIQKGEAINAHVIVVVDKFSTREEHKAAGKNSSELKELIPTGKGGFDFCDKSVQFIFTSYADWTELLGMIRQDFPANRTIFVTISHGSGIGFPEKDLDFHPSLVCPDTSDEISQEYCRNMEMLWMSELSNAIRDGYGKGVDIMLMNNCYMQTFETGVTLSEQVQFLVAPETTTKLWGPDYRFLLEQLTPDTGIQTIDLVRSIKKAYIEKWIRTGHAADLCENTLIMADLSYYKLLHFYFKKIAKRFCQMDDKELALLIRFRRRRIRAVTFSPCMKTGSGAAGIHFVDIVPFFHAAQRILSSDSRLVAWINIFENVLEQAIVDKHIGPDFEENDWRCTQNDKDCKQKYRISGISVFVPYTKDTYAQLCMIHCAYFGRHGLLGDGKPMLPEFTQMNAWNAFIERYSKMLMSPKWPL